MHMHFMQIRFFMQLGKSSWGMRTRTFFMTNSIMCFSKQPTAMHNMCKNHTLYKHTATLFCIFFHDDSQCLPATPLVQELGSMLQSSCSYKLIWQNGKPHSGSPLNTTTRGRSDSFADGTCHTSAAVCKHPDKKHGGQGDL